ncbi:hypothetical protein FKG94_16365 [Exilibacterium tricleocarpae]|uniref:Cytochrome c domain-containing protein n=1 Tax=Exilibacterium tricleocarpae TaxID=2591008 RepID=A0A545TAE3_9GAMM|nr:c-type cytochrome [Exilibacterium tricleocarpae]TQV74180.1 hypothetical protein FKG94_16365 [Exilibacterium tricleocarpae]
MSILKKVGILKVKLSVVFLVVLSGLPVVADEAAKSLPLVELCKKCHGPGGESAIPGWPPIAGMTKSELVSKLKGYRAKLVPESRMADVTHNFTDDQIEVIAQYYAELGSGDSK